MRDRRFTRDGVVFSAIGVGAVSLIALVGLVVYGEATEIDAGRVVERVHSPSHVQFVPTWNGKSMTQTMVVHPERWSIVVEGRGEDGEIRTGDCDVDSETYERIEKGQWFKCP